MSLYNTINGVNPATFYIFPMLEIGHPDNVERFRDCFLEDDKIVIYTRTGGWNREDYPNEILTNHQNYLYDEDDEFDCTYANYYFSIPEKWKKDLEVILNGNVNDTSKEYQELVKKSFPKIKDKLESIFKGEE